MPYSTLADVQFAAGGSDRLQELSDFERGDAISEDNVNAAIAEADGWINMFVQKRSDLGDIATLNGQVALTDPSQIRAISRNEAVYVLKKNRGMATEADDDAHAERAARLTAFADGEITLGFQTFPAPSALVVDETTDMPDDRAISRNKLKGFA